MKREDLWSQIRQGLKEGIQYTVNKTEELTRIGRLKLEIASQKRKIARQLGELGGRVYQLLGAEDVQTNDLAGDERIDELVGGLKELEAELDRLGQELTKVQEAGAAEEEGVAEGVQETAEAEEQPDEEVSIRVTEETIEQPQEESPDSGDGDQQSETEKQE